MGSCRLCLLDKNAPKTIAMAGKMDLKKPQSLGYRPLLAITNIQERPLGTDLIFALPMM